MAGTTERPACPFCASTRTGLYATTRHVEEAWFHVSCEDCHAAGPWRISKEAAERAWAARATGAGAVANGMEVSK